MKLSSIICLILWTNITFAQINNQQSINSSNLIGINASPYNIKIVTQVLYNAIPDGYKVTYTKSFISKTVAAVEQMMNKKTDQLIANVKSINIAPQEVLVDVVSLDPIFNLHLERDSLVERPIGYKITENITFKISNLSTLRELSKICLEHDIYDLLKIRPFVNNTTPIMDSLAQKAVEILEMKKQFSENIGWKFHGGKLSFQKRKQVFYPNERYLKQLVNNDNIYQHNIAQNTTINYNRHLSTNQQYHLNLKSADFIFNASANAPIVQFHYELIYQYTKVDTEAELRKKIENEQKSKKDKLIYILDDNGELKPIRVN